MKLDQSSSDERTGTKSPLELENSGVNFAIFGFQDRMSVITVKSDTAPLELLGSYPLEELEISSQSYIEFLYDLIDFSAKPVHWIMSLPFRTAAQSSESERLVLVWQGLATASDKLLIKRILDRNASDIDEAAKSDDHWRGVISVSPVIAQCKHAQAKNRRLGAMLWVFAAIVVLAGLRLMPT